MNTLIILGAIVGMPILLALVLRVNAVFIFLAVATGALLSQYISDDASLVLTSFFTRVSVDQYVKLGLLILPLILTLLILRKSMSPAQFPLHVVPLIVTCAAFATLVISNLPGGVQHNISSDHYGHISMSSQNVLIAAASVLTLVLAFITGGHKSKSKGKHH